MFLLLYTVLCSSTPHLPQFSDYLFFSIFPFLPFQNLSLVTSQFYSLIYHADKDNCSQIHSNQNHANLYIDFYRSQIYMYFSSQYYLLFGVHTSFYSDLRDWLVSFPISDSWRNYFVLYIFLN